MSEERFVGSKAKDSMLPLEEKMWVGREIISREHVAIFSRDKSLFQIAKQFWLTSMLKLKLGKKRFKILKSLLV